VLGYTSLFYLIIRAYISFSCSYHSYNHLDVYFKHQYEDSVIKLRLVLILFLLPCVIWLLVVCAF